MEPSFLACIRPMLRCSSMFVLYAILLDFSSQGWFSADTKLANKDALPHRPPAAGAAATLLMYNPHRLAFLTSYQQTS